MPSPELLDALSSRTLVWLPVHRYAAGLAALLGVDLGDRLPYPGTISWLDLPDGSPVKKAALLLAASHHVLRLEIEQEAKAEASKAVAASADWPAIAREVQELAGARKSGTRIELVSND